MCRGACGLPLHHLRRGVSRICWASHLPLHFVVSWSSSSSLSLSPSCSSLQLHIISTFSLFLGFFVCLFVCFSFSLFFFLYLFSLVSKRMFCWSSFGFVSVSLRHLFNFSYFYVYLYLSISLLSLLSVSLSILYFSFDYSSSHALLIPPSYFSFYLPPSVVHISQTLSLSHFLFLSDSVYLNLALNSELTWAGRQVIQCCQYR